MVKYLSFHNSSSFALTYFFPCKWQGHSVTRPLRCCCFHFAVGALRACRSSDALPCKLSTSLCALFWHFEDGGLNSCYRFVRPLSITAFVCCFCVSWSSSSSSSSSSRGGGIGASTPTFPLVFSKAENLCKLGEGGATNRQILAFFPTLLENHDKAFVDLNQIQHL